jgi:hypothetical protein
LFQKYWSQQPSKRKAQPTLRAIGLKRDVSPSILFKAQTSPPGQTIQRSGSSELSARVASLVAQYRLYEVGPSQQTQSDRGSGTGPAMDKPALRSSSARQSPCANGRSTRLVRRQGMGVSYGFRCPAMDQASLGRRRLGLLPLDLSPLPLSLVKPCGRRGIKKPVFVSFTHPPCCSRPARPRVAPSTNHNATWLGFKFNFVSELGFL